MTNLQSEIRDLAVIGDRRTAALITRTASVVWYCPVRFDKPSLFAALLDREKGGKWSIDFPGSSKRRQYVEDSAVLETQFESDSGDFTVTDWMSVGDTAPSGICRLFSRAPQPVTVSLIPAPNYASSAADLQPTADDDGDGNGVCINGMHWFHASHPVSLEDGMIRFTVAAGEEAWAVLLDVPAARPDDALVRSWLEMTLVLWRDIASRITYHGPFEREVAQSLRALRLLTHAQSGGIIAAATAALPEVQGGSRNYDYRYVWTRDAGMIVSALVRAGSEGTDEKHFLEFICGSKLEQPGKPLLPPFLSLDFKPAPKEFHLDFSGYNESRPVRIGNNANCQLQLDGFANVLLAAKLIYGRYDTREHWSTVREIADFLAEHWRDPDYGMWEENAPRQHTASKVIASCGLRYIADFAEDESQARRWRAVSKEIEEYVACHCINSEGAYAAVAGSEAVDVSAVLFPTWGYTAADSPEMLATIRTLERDSSDGQLYWRHLEELDCRKEGAFLAGTIWVAQYWVMRKDLGRTKRILEAALAYANDLGFFAEEASPGTGHMLGNFPQTFVHAAFIGAVIDYRNALKE